MNRGTRTRLSMAARALDYARAHPSTDASFVAVVARLQADVTLAEQLTIAQVDGTNVEQGARGVRTSVRRNQLARQLRHIKQVADEILPDHPELAGHFTNPGARAPNRLYIAAAKRMLADATTNKDLLVAKGLGEQFLDELSQAIDTYDAATTAEHDGRGNHVVAKTDLQATVADGVKQVRILDGLYQSLFSGSPDILDGWKSAKNVAGPFTRTTAAPAPDAPPG